MTWQPPEPALHDGVTLSANGKWQSTENGYTLEQLLAVRQQTIEECAKVCEPKSKRPCDCVSCDCSNSGDAARTTEWDVSMELAAAIRKLKELT